MALVDLRMPDLDGASVIAEIRRTDPSGHVIILTTYDTEEDIYQGIRAGARGYLLKDARRHDVLDAIRRVNAGETLLAADVTAKLAQRVTDETLTDRERAVRRRSVRDLKHLKRKGAGGRSDHKGSLLTICPAIQQTECAIREGPWTQELFHYHRVRRRRPFGNSSVILTRPCRFSKPVLVVMATRSPFGSRVMANS